ncbi:MAG: AAA-like domain-containing protein [Deltaproteobacteria bacterium]|nr:AAA-like domain-containing protein [Deltaproteobacteria bacterium]
MLPVLPRVPEARNLIDNEKYFTIHAPRQSGKTTFLKALANKINEEGKYYALYCSLEALDNLTDIDYAITNMLGVINESLKISGIENLKQLAYPNDALPQSVAAIKIKNMLNYLSVNLDKDLVVFFDEADCLAPQPLIMFLRQIRSGYIDRENCNTESKFPRTLVLIGMRDIQDYIPQIRPNAESKGLASPFNISAGSFTLTNFSAADIKLLYGQHTDATGQVFDPLAIKESWRLTEGQPWLVNALAKEIIEKRLQHDFSKTIEAKDFQLATETLLLRDDAHFRSLKERLKEPRVRRVMEAVIVGKREFPREIAMADIRFAIDLGLLKTTPGDARFLRPANPIYQEIIIRTLTEGLQEAIDLMIPKKYVNKWMDGQKLDMSALLKAFQLFWRDNCEILAEKNAKMSYLDVSVYQALENLNIIFDNAKKKKEAASAIKSILSNLVNESMTHLALQAFLQRVLNGEAFFIRREYALGRSRVDILVSYKDAPYPIELKIKGVQSLKASLRQLLSYMNKCGAPEGWLVIFDKNFKKPWRKRLFLKNFKTSYGQKLRVFGC